MIVTASTVWFVALLVYLADCVLVVDRGQAIFERAHGRWLARFGSLHFVLRGRPVVMLNPIAPWRAVVRTLPLFAARSRDVPSLSRIIGAVMPLGLLVAAQGLLVLLVLPLLMNFFPGWPFVACLAAVYLNALFIVGMLSLRRPTFGLSIGAIAMLAAYSLLCIPLSINATRKAALGHPIGHSSWAMMRLLRGVDLEEAQMALAAQVLEARLDCDEASQESARLEELAATIDKRRRCDECV